MSDDAELSISELRRKRAQSGSPSSNPASQQPVTDNLMEPTVVETIPRPVPVASEVTAATAQREPQRGEPEDKLDLPFDPWRLPEALRKRWYWLVAGACVLD